MKAKNKFCATSEVGATGTIRRRILLALAALMIVCGAMAQSQRGVVRTAQRPGKQAQKLAGVTIRLRGGNAAVTSPDGAFTLGMDGARAGDALILQSVRKIGYELVDKESVGRALAYSPNVPIEIVMLNSREKEEDMQRIYDNAYRRAEQTYAERNAALERQLNDKTVSEEAYRQQLQELQQWFDKYQTLINDMAERYASMDYATIDTLNMAINEAIERGDMERADSLISTAGSLEKLVSECMEERQATARRQAAVDQIAKEVEAEKQRNRERTRSTGELLYSKYSTSLAKQQRDTAAHYIMLRAELDTMNVDWQLDASSFVYDYASNHDRAISLCHRALRNALAQYGENSDLTAKAYMSTGRVLGEMGRFDEAQDNLMRALTITTALHGENHSVVALIYNWLGSLFKRQLKDSESIDYYRKALDIALATCGDDQTLVVDAYDGIGDAFGKLLDFDEALLNNEKALAIALKQYGEQHYQTARIYNSRGIILARKGENAQALVCYDKALDAYTAIFGENHLHTIITLNNKGVNLFLQGRYDEALDIANRVTKGMQRLLGEGHPYMTYSYRLLGTSYLRLGNHAEALTYLNKALQISNDAYGETNALSAAIMTYIGEALAAEGRYAEALETSLQGIDMLKKTGRTDSDLNIEVYGSVYKIYVTAMASSDDYAAGFAQFMADKAFTLTTDSCAVTADGQPAGGEYWLLEIDGRSENDRDDLIEYVESKAEAVRTALVSDGRRAIKLHIGSQCKARLNMKWLEPKEKKELTDIHNKWKKKHESK